MTSSPSRWPQLLAGLEHPDLFWRLLALAPGNKGLWQDFVRCLEAAPLPIGFAAGRTKGRFAY